MLGSHLQGSLTTEYRGSIRAQLASETLWMFGAIMIVARYDAWPPVSDRSSKYGTDDSPPPMDAIVHTMCPLR